MTTLTDISNKKAELDVAIDAHTSAVDGGIPANITSTLAAAKIKGDEFAKLLGSYKSENPGLDENTVFSNPTLMTSERRDAVKYMVINGEAPVLGMLLRVNTLGGANEYAYNKVVTVNLSGGSNVEINWGDGGPVEVATTTISHTYTNSGSFDIEIKGTITGFNNQPVITEKYGILDVLRWGSIDITDYTKMFNNAKNLQITAVDSPNFKPGTNCSEMLSYALNFNSDISHWDMSNVINANRMFMGCNKFNQSLNSWNVSGITNMEYMFYGCSLYNQPMSSWNVGNVTNMSYIFRNCSVFNQNISMWNVSNVMTNEQWAHGTALLIENRPTF